MSEIVQLYKCDACGNVITDPKDGIVIHGNIYAADPTTNAGIIGNNFPNRSEMDKSPAEQTNKSVYCKGCFLKAVFPELKLTRSEGFFGDRPL